jgi:oligopeptidase B
MQPPRARRQPTERLLHGETSVDDFAWLRDRDDPETIPYLEAENAFTAHETAHLDALRQTIFDEIKTRTQETDLSAPSRKGDWWYAARTEEGKQYPIMVRMAGTPDGPEQVLLDLNLLAEGHEYLQLGVFAISPDHRLLAYSTDTDGSEYFTLRVRDLATGVDLPDVIERTYYTAAWSADSSVLFYTTTDHAHRPDKIWRHRLGTDRAGDELAFHEEDERMFASVGSSQDARYILVSCGSQVTSDTRFLSAADPAGSFRPVLPRIHGVEYSAEHKDGRWVVVTNHEAVNGKLLSIAVEDYDDVVELIAHDESTKVSSVLPLSGHLVVFGRKNALTSISIVADGGDLGDLAFDETVYSVGPGRNLEYDTSILRITYQSLVTPARVIDIDLESGARTVVKETPVLGGFDPRDYEAWREWATAGDGARIPVSLVRRKGVAAPGPALLYGYGSYEIPVDPWFSIARLSLLDRGVLVALAHVRGGGELGKPWYEAGKLSRKQNTFSDFIACADHLIAGGYTTPDRLAARGGSAGGLLMGAVANQAPDRFATIVAEVPFVDVVTTMLDETLPLTVIEWEEWGNPRQPDDFGWIRAYSPYDNTGPIDYPAMLVTAGLNDPRVAFWEPAKWVAKMRVTGRHRGPLLLKTEMGAGHAGPSGRYGVWKDEAFVLAFILDRIAREAGRRDSLDG